MSFSPDKENESPRVWRHILALVGTLFSLGSHAQFDGGVSPRVDASAPRVNMDASIPRASMDASVPRVNMDASVPRASMDAGVAQNRTPYQQQCVSTEINIGARHPHLHQPGRPGVYLRNVCIHDLGVMLDPRVSTGLRGQPSFVLFRVLDVNPVTKELSLGIIPSNNPDMPHWGHPVVRDLVRSGEDLRFQRDFEEEERPRLVIGTQYYFRPNCVPRYTRGSLVATGSTSSDHFHDEVDTCGPSPIYNRETGGYPIGLLRGVFHSPFRSRATHLFYSPLCLYSVSRTGSFQFGSCFRLIEANRDLVVPAVHQELLARILEETNGFVFPRRHLHTDTRTRDEFRYSRCFKNMGHIEVPAGASLRTCFNLCEGNSECLGVYVNDGRYFCRLVGLFGKLNSQDELSYLSPSSPRTSFIRSRWTPEVERQCRKISQRMPRLPSSGGPRFRDRQD